MPIENERKFVLEIDLDPQSLAGWNVCEIEQKYLDDGPRIRRFGDIYFFTYKKWIETEQCLVEIELEISEVDYSRLSTCVIEGLIKTRFIKQIGQEEWVVDFLKSPVGEIYFAMAEVEMPENQESYTSIPPEIIDHIVYEVPHKDNRFTNKKLADEKYARALYKQISC